MKQPKYKITDTVAPGIFFWLEPWRTPDGDTIQIAKHEDKYYPITGYAEKKMFIYGKGYVKVGKAITIPKWNKVNPTYDDVYNYVKEYGMEAFFYSITGQLTSSNDCVVWRSSQEVKVALSDIENGSLKHCMEFTQKVNEMNDKICDIITERFKLDMNYPNNKRMQWLYYGMSQEVDTDKSKIVTPIEDLFYVRPSYSLMAYILCKPYVDVIQDDDRLFKHLSKTTIIDYSDDNAILTFDKDFPVCMKDRITFLFNKEISDDYEKLMEH